MRQNLLWMFTLYLPSVETKACVSLDNNIARSCERLSYNQRVFLLAKEGWLNYVLASQTSSTNPAVLFL